jgi:energy-coupling factor transporter ATP-binding protein EcfA2
MKKVLIATVGGSSELIVNAIAHAQPDFVYFLCSTGKGGSDATIEKTIVPSTRLPPGSYVVERVQAIHDLRDVTAACARIETDLDARFAGEDLDVVANYTGGTRTMSTGLGALALRRGWNAEVTERPARPWSGRITKASLTAVTGFSHIELPCSKGINVIIGENGTGKTQLLKCMYALLRASEDADTKPVRTDRGDKLERVLAGRARSHFAAEDVPSRVQVECEHAAFEREESPGAPASWTLPRAVGVRTLFLPAREVLAMYRGFVKAYDDQKLSFDETYYDLCGELGREELLEPAPSLSPVLTELEGIIGGEVRLDFNSFVVETKRGPITASMVAEGHRKLATLAYLIKTGALTTESVLFWDEPEANLNPKLVRVVAKVIWRLARAGVQIFLATHDYLLSRELSMEAEYRPEEEEAGDRPEDAPRFFVLHRTSDDAPVEVESGAYWSDLKPNPIFEAYADHYDYEQDLFASGPEKEAS